MSKEQDAKREALALAKAMYNAAWPGAPWRDSGTIEQSLVRAAHFILAREAEREGPLVEALEAIGRKSSQCADHGGPFCGDIARAALARRRALDAPPHRTPPLEVFGIKVILADGVERPIMFTEEGLREALKREEGKR